jgi:hypothetical protein
VIAQLVDETSGVYRVFKGAVASSSPIRCAPVASA